MSPMPPLRRTRRTNGALRDFSDEAALFRAFGDVHRLRIIATLVRSKAPVTVRTLATKLPINQSSVSFHLNVLRGIGVVVNERQGTWGYYYIAPGMRARLAKALKAILRERWYHGEES